ncbi:PLP-dependent transferase [Abortiporus biennis]|nr:PLP-dependent transferase [Abortiporus biennis]
MTEGRSSPALLSDDFYEPFLSKLAKNRQPDRIRVLIPLESRPGLISFLAGKPNPEMFPLTSLSFTARDPQYPSKEIPIDLTPEELKVALQYNYTDGVPALRDWIHELQEHVHKRKKDESWKVSIGAGSQDLIYKAITALVNPGDPVLVETPAYGGTIPMFTTLGCDISEVETDAEGLSSQSLRKILEEWPASKPKPKVLYTVPYGCNPTGITTTTERRLEVLKLAREHNFLILEDDPYYFLYYGAAPRPPSYFELDGSQPEVGRVIRFDSFSKMLSSGFRLGFVSGPTYLIAAMDLHSSTANLQPSSLSQIVALSILKRWGLSGFLKHGDTVAEFYKQKRDKFEAAMKKHLSGLAEWDTPKAGMFFWFKILLPEGPDQHDSEPLITTKAFEKGVLAIPGTVFLPNAGKSPYVRVSFSLLGEEDIDEALKRLKEAILELKAEAKASSTS